MAPPTVTGVSPTSGPTTGGTVGHHHRDRLHRGQRRQLRGHGGLALHRQLGHPDHRHHPLGVGGDGRRDGDHRRGHLGRQPAERPVHLRRPRRRSPGSARPRARPPAGRRSPSPGPTSPAPAPSASGATAASSYTVNSATQITATTHSASAGTVDVDGDRRPGAPRPPTRPTTSSPTWPRRRSPGSARASGPTTGGTVGHHHRHRLHRGQRGQLRGDRRGSSYTVDSATQITATDAAAAAGTVDVRVTTAGGTSAVNAPSDQFTYVGPADGHRGQPELGPDHRRHRRSPSPGPASPGPAPSTSGPRRPRATRVNSATQITATTHSASAGTVDVTVTTSGGTSSANPPNDQFTYVGPADGHRGQPDLGPDHRRDLGHHHRDQLHRRQRRRLRGHRSLELHRQLGHPDHRHHPLGVGRDGRRRR